MTVAAETIRAQYSGNGSTDTFAYTCLITDSSELKVVLTDTAEVDTVLASAYSLSGVGDAGGGNVYMDTAPATGERVTIYRDSPMTQTMDLESGGAWSPATIEAAFDKQMRIIQELQEELGRCTKTDITDED